MSGVGAVPLVDKEPGAGWSIDAIIDGGAVRTLFQPVVHLVSGSVAGFEALSRGPVGSALESPLALLLAAQGVGRLGELDWLCRCRAMQAAADAGLPDSLSWLVNVEPAGLSSNCPPHLSPVLARARAGMRVILEVVERDMQVSVLELLRASDQARRDSWGVALDDVGAVEESLALLPFLRPDVVKLDMSLVQEVPGAMASAITGAVRAYAERTGAVILAEGIENQAQENRAKVFGATFGQGYYYGRPGPLPASVDVPSHPIPLAQYVRPLDGRTPFEVLASTVAPQRAEKQHLLHISDYLEGWADRSAHASVLLAGFQQERQFSAAKRARYDRLAAANALTIVLGDGLDLHDEPTYHIGPRPVGSRVRGEWAVIVINPHGAAAFVARTAEPAAVAAQRQFDFVYTYDRDVVIDAARSFLQDLSETAYASPAPSTHDDSSPVHAAHPAPRSEARRTTDSALAPPGAGAASLLAGQGAFGSGAHRFRATSQIILDYLNAAMPMSFWSITRVENDRQTYLYLDDNDYHLAVGASHPWKDSYCVHMVAGTAPRIAPDAAAVPLYAAAAVNRAVQIGAYAGAPIVEADGSTFGAICGLDTTARDDIAHFGPILDVFSTLLTAALAADRALEAATRATRVALTFATTDALTGTHNRRAWDDAIVELQADYADYADPAVVVIVDLNNVSAANDGPGGHTAGDQQLRTAVRVIRRAIRDGDFLARLGAEEFGIILHAMPSHLAPAIVTRLTRVLDHAGIPASAGWSPLVPGRAVTNTLTQAERAMSDAKHRHKHPRRR